MYDLCLVQWLNYFTCVPRQVGNYTEFFFSFFSVKGPSADAVLSAKRTDRQPDLLAARHFLFFIFFRVRQTCGCRWLGRLC